MTIKPLIVVIDGNSVALAETIRILRAADFIAKGFPSAEEFLDSSCATLTRLLIADANLTGIGGLELYGRLAAIGRPTPMILTTVRPDDGARQRALSAGIAGYLTKPLNQKDLVDCIQRAVRHGASFRPVDR